MKPASGDRPEVADGGSEGLFSDRVEELLAQCLESAGADSATTIARICERHPEHSDELRRRLAALDLALAELAPRPGEETGEETGGETGAGIREEIRELGDFRLEERLGSGGMGLVFAAEQRSLGRRVALKLVRPDLLLFGAGRTRFRREVEAVARLEHPGIVPILAVGEEHGIPYFAMQLVPGRTLAAVLATVAQRAPDSLTGADLLAALGGPAGDAAELPRAWHAGWVRAVLDIARQIALALAHAHEHGVLHRDVKPSNIIVKPDGSALLIDFGLATSTDGESLTRSGALLGTLHYVAPEQLRGERALDGRADVYGLAATLYELLALQTPHRGDTAAELSERVQVEPPDSLAVRNRAVWKDVETVVRCALSPERHRRYASAAEFAADLENLLERRPIRARPPTPWVRLVRWAERRPARAVASCAALLFFLVVPGGVLLRERAHAGELERVLEDERAQRKHAQAALTFAVSLFRASDPNSSQCLETPARVLLDRGAERARTELADDPTLQARILFHIGDVYSKLGGLAQARGLLGEALELDRSAPDTDPLILSMTLNSLGTTEWRAGNYGRAEELFRETLELQELQGGEPAGVAGARNNLALVLRAQGRTEEAEVELSRAIEDYEFAEDESGRAHALANLAELQTTVDRHDEAFANIQSALPILRRYLQTPSPALLAALNTLGRAQRHRGDLAGAAASYEEALAQSKTLFGEESAPVATLTFNLALLEESRGDDEAALALFSEAAALSERVLGPDHPDARMVQGELELRRARSGAATQ